jgi:gamma-glutamyltranspeptidase/glutathione hydrolase
VVAPAVKLAADGVVVDIPLAASLERALRRGKDFSELQRVFGKKGGKWQAGDTLVQPELAKTLARIADRGPDGFYNGRTAELLVKEMKAGGGLITAEDLAGCSARLRKPIHGTYRGHDVYVPPPPSSGLCLVQMLNVLEQFDLKKHGHLSTPAVHLMVETMRRAYADRARYLGDPDFTRIPAHLTSKEYAKKLARGIDPEKATRSADVAPEVALRDEKPNTTHYSIIDSTGMAVSTTTTLEESFGSRVVVRGAGFLLNNEMTDFNPSPGVTTRTGTIGTAPNLIAPGKRMLSSMTPTIVVKGGKVVLVTGSPGGRTILNTVLGVTLGVLEFGLPLRQAVDAPRLHHQWFPDRVQVEARLAKLHPRLIAELKKRGHAVRTVRSQGDAHSIWLDPSTGKYQGARDARRAGAEP